eukprot:TRINITY_DN20322_c0_g1_i1.p1 TRINITY_DN20322_c0_g1~~TRINITY_DN20322_c0_g1_i1.p1  ORF type:complete len:103 (+),score=19.50 TRINITY_DN20322_c0_g1_i1:109-417(+)
MCIRDRLKYISVSSSSCPLVDSPSTGGLLGVFPPVSSPTKLVKTPPFFSADLGTVAGDPAPAAAAAGSGLWLAVAAVGVCFVSFTHLPAPGTGLELVCRLFL